MAGYSYDTSLGGVTLKVSTELMQSTAQDILTKSNNVKDQFDNMVEIIQRTSSYWRGETANKERESLKSQSDNVTEMVENLRAFVEELKLMGQNYEKAEKTSTDSANELPTNILE